MICQRDQQHLLHLPVGSIDSYLMVAVADVPSAAHHGKFQIIYINISPTIGVGSGSTKLGLSSGHPRSIASIGLRYILGHGLSYGLPRFPTVHRHTDGVESGLNSGLPLGLRPVLHPSALFRSGYLGRAP
jgi:hypothetical protein